MDRRRWENLSEARLSYESGASQTAFGPLEAFFEVAARCNLHCQMCAINYDSRYKQGSKRPPYLTPELFRRLEPTFPTLLKAYLFGLGEPLLNKHLVDYVKTLSLAAVEVWFNTNATLIDDAKAEQLAQAGVTAITVSIDGASPETYERIRVGAKYEAVVRGIRALIRASRIYGRPHVDLSFVGMASNLHELPQLVDFAAQVGARSVHVEPLYSQIQHDLQEHYARENLGILGSGRIDALFAEAQRRARAAGLHLASRFLTGGGSADYVERARGLGVWWTCSEPWTSIWVTAAGEVRTCCLNDTSFGNLFETSFEAIWNGSAFARVRELHRARREMPTGCGNCVRNGRVRHSPYLAALEPVTYRPLRSPQSTDPEEVDGAQLECPRDGEFITDPLVIRGRMGRRQEPPDLIVDRRFPLRLAEVAVWNSEEFAATIAIPYLTEGAHLLSLRHGGGKDYSTRTVHVWQPIPKRPDAIRAISALAIDRSCWQGVSRAAIEVDGRPWVASAWMSRRTPRGWKGIAWLDLSGLEPGPHRVSIQPRWHLPKTYEVDKLPIAEARSV